MASPENIIDLITYYKKSDNPELVADLECLMGSHQTLMYNQFDIDMEYGDHMMHREEDIEELESGPLPVFQYKFHNYITSSYSFTENVRTALSNFDEGIRDVFESEYYGTPVEKAIRGLRIYAQHHRVLPLYIKRVEADNDRYKLVQYDHENLVIIDIDELVESKQDWGGDARDYFFEEDKLDFINGSEMNTIQAIDAHYGLSNGVYHWCVEQLCNMVSDV